MADIPRVDSVPNPPYPCTHKELEDLNPELFAKLVAQNAAPWWNFISQMKATAEELQQIGYQHETIGNFRAAQIDDLTQEKDQAIMERDQYKDLTLRTQGELLQAQKELMNRMKRTPDATNTTTPRKDRSAKHPDPAMYSGGREELDAFVTQLRAKLVINDDHFVTEKQKIYYAVSRLEKSAMTYVMPHLKADNTTDYEKAEDLIKTLTTAFGDPDKQGTAQRELRNLKQRNMDFASFIAMFQRWAPETGFDNNSLISFLTDSISMELRQAMITQDTPTKLSEYIELLQRMDNRIRALPTSTLRIPNSRLLSTNKVVNYTPSISVTPPAPFAAPFIAPSIAPSDSLSNLGHVPMDLDNTRRGPVPPEEKMRRRALGLCSYCGGVGHMTYKCPLFKCYNCGEIGHAIEKCTKPRKLRVQGTFSAASSAPSLVYTPSTLSENDRSL